MDENTTCNEPKGPCLCRCPCHYKPSTNSHSGSRQNNDAQKSVLALPWKPMENGQQPPSTIEQISTSDAHQSELYSSFDDEDEDYLPIASAVISKSLIHARNIVKKMKARWEILSTGPVDESQSRPPNRFSITSRQINYKENDTGNWQRESVVEGETKKHEWKQKTKVPDNFEEHAYVFEPLQNNKELVAFNKSHSRSQSPNTNSTGDDNPSQSLQFGYFVDENGKDMSDYSSPSTCMKPTLDEPIHPTNPFKSPSYGQQSGVDAILYPKPMMPNSFSPRPFLVQSDSEKENMRKSMQAEVDEIVADAERTVNPCCTGEERSYLTGENAMAQESMPINLPPMTNPVAVKSVKAYPIKSEVKNIRKSFEEEMCEILTDAERTIHHSNNTGERDPSAGEYAMAHESLHINLPPMTNPVAVKSVKAYPIKSEVKNIRKSFEGEMCEILTDAERTIHHSNNTRERHPSAGENATIQESMQVNLPPMTNPVTVKSIRAYPIQSEVKNIRKSFEEKADEIVANAKRTSYATNSNDQQDRSPENAFILKAVVKQDMPNNGGLQFPESEESTQKSVEEHGVRKNEGNVRIPSPPQVINNSIDDSSTSLLVHCIRTQYGINLQSIERQVDIERHVEKARLPRSVDTPLRNSYDGRPVSESNQNDGNRRHSAPSKIKTDLQHSFKPFSQEKQNTGLKNNIMLPGARVNRTYAEVTAQTNASTGNPNSSKRVPISPVKTNLKESGKQKNKTTPEVEHPNQEKDLTYLAWISVPKNDGVSSEINSDVSPAVFKPVVGTNSIPKREANNTEICTKYEPKAQQPQVVIANMCKEYDSIVPTHPDVQIEITGQSVSLTNVSAKMQQCATPSQTPRRSAPTPATTIFSSEIIFASSLASFSSASSQRRKQFYICRRCNKIVESEKAVFYSSGQSEISWHAHCFKCSTCEKKLSQTDHNFHEEEPYCLEHYEIAVNIPKCFKCHELIRDPTFTAAGGYSWHQLHFICKCCKRPLIDSEYVFVDSKHPFCIPCHATLYPKQCKTCQQRILPQEPYIQAGDLFWHSNNSCLYCFSCNGGLVGRSLFFRQDGRLYCNRYCALHEMQSIF